MALPHTHTRTYEKLDEALGGGGKGEQLYEYCYHRVRFRVTPSSCYPPFLFLRIFPHPPFCTSFPPTSCLQNSYSTTVQCSCSSPPFLPSHSHLQLLLLHFQAVTPTLYLCMCPRLGVCSHGVCVYRCGSCRERRSLEEAISQLLTYSFIVAACLFICAQPCRPLGTPGSKDVRNNTVATVFCSKQ